MTRWRIRSWKSCSRTSRTRLDDALIEHRVRDLEEAGDVGPVDVVAGGAEALRRLQAGGMDALHDDAEPVVHLLARPGEAHAVLGHLQPGDGHPARVGGLARTVEDARVQELHDAVEV